MNLKKTLLMMAGLFASTTTMPFGMDDNKPTSNRTDGKKLREYSWKGQKIMAYSKTDAKNRIRKLNATKKVIFEKNLVRAKHFGLKICF